MDRIESFQTLLRFKSITPNDDGAFDFITNYLGKSWQCISLDIKDVKNRFYYKNLMITMNIYVLQVILMLFLQVMDGVLILLKQIYHL